MKRIDNTEIWTDGVVKYKKNAQGDFEVYHEPEHVVEPLEPVILKPVTPIDSDVAEPGQD